MQAALSPVAASKHKGSALPKNKEADVNHADEPPIRPLTHAADLYQPNHLVQTATCTGLNSRLAVSSTRVCYLTIAAITDTRTLSARVSSHLTAAARDLVVPGGPMVALHGTARAHLKTKLHKQGNNFVAQFQTNK